MYKLPSNIILVNPEAQEDLDIPVKQFGKVLRSVHNNTLNEVLSAVTTLLTNSNGNICSEDMLVNVLKAVNNLKLPLEKEDK